jgi:pimeloyl-ACP methyl ester carboxylesterase
MSKFLLLGFAILTGFVAQAAPDFADFIPVKNKKEIYVEYVKAQKGKPTIVLLNGLTYGLRQYDSLANALIERGVGVVRIDFQGMGQTLLKYAPVTEPISYKTQVDDTKSVLTTLKIKSPYNFAGLSYGGGIGLAYAIRYPEDINNLILMAPYTQPLEGQDKWIKSQIWATRQMYPWNKYSDDDLYDYFLHQIVYATYPQAEPIVLENPFKLDAVYNLVRGIRKYTPLDEVDNLPKKRVHLMMAGNDQYIPAKILNDFWDALPKDVKLSRIKISGVEHKMNEAAPNFTAAWLTEIMMANPLLQQGLDFEGNPYTGKAKAGKHVIDLMKD